MSVRTFPWESADAFGSSRWSTKQDSVLIALATNKQTSWASIALEVSKVGPDRSAGACSARWRIIRGSERV